MLQITEELQQKTINLINSGYGYQCVPRGVNGIIAELIKLQPVPDTAVKPVTSPPVLPAAPTVVSTPVSPVAVDAAVAAVAKKVAEVTEEKIERRGRKKKNK